MSSEGKEQEGSCFINLGQQHRKRREGRDCRIAGNKMVGVLYPSGHQSLLSEREWLGDNGFKVPGGQGGWEQFTLAQLLSQ